MTFASAWLEFAPSDMPQPRPHWQFDKNLNFSLDWTFPDDNCMLSVELDRNANVERSKYNAAAVAGFRIIHLTSAELEANPQKWINFVVGALGLL